LGLAWRSAAAALAVVLAAGCGGGSVADTDTPAPTRAQHQPSDAFCAAVTANAEAARPLVSLSARGGRVADIRNVADAVRSTNLDVLATAPAEIRAAVERTVDVANLQLDALEAAGGDLTAAARDGTLTARVNAPESVDAARKVRAYVERNCGVRSSGGASG